MLLLLVLVKVIFEKLLHEMIRGEQAPIIIISSIVDAAVIARLTRRLTNSSSHARWSLSSSFSDCCRGLLLLLQTR